MSAPDIIDMAMAAGFERIVAAGDDWVCSTDDIKALVKMAMAREREECARLAERAEPYQATDLIRARARI